MKEQMTLTKRLARKEQHEPETISGIDGLMADKLHNIHVQANRILVWDIGDAL